MSARLAWRPDPEDRADWLTSAFDSATNVSGWSGPRRSRKPVATSSQVGVDRGARLGGVLQEQGKVTDAISQLVRDDLRSLRHSAAQELDALLPVENIELE
jgi:hypothetical protein